MADGTGRSAQGTLKDIVKVYTSSFRNKRYRNATELRKHVWNLKDQNIQYNIKWRKIKQARSYPDVTNKCNLRLWEKNILFYVNHKCHL